MRILVVDEDVRLSGILEKVLGSQGYDVTVISGVHPAREHLRRQPTAMIVCELDMPGGGPLAALGEYRATTDGRQASIVLSSMRSEDDPKVRAAMEQLGCRLFCRKPYSVLDLSDLARRVDKERQQGKAPPPPRPKAKPSVLPPTEEEHEYDADPPSAPPDETALSFLRDRPNASGRDQPRGGRRGSVSRTLNERNVATLTRLWANRSSGVLQLRSGRGGSEGWANLETGGPMDEPGWDIVHEAMMGGELSFEPAPIDGRGDWQGMGAMLFGAVRDAGKVRFAKENRYQALVRTAWSDATGGLPVSDALRRVVEAADGQTTVGELLAREGLSADAVSADLDCLRRLRVVDIQAPVARPLHETAQRMVEAEREDSGVSSSARSRSDVSRSRARSRGRGRGAGAAGSDAHRTHEEHSASRSVSEVISRVRAARGTAEQAPATSVQDRRSSVSGARSPRSSSRANTDSRGDAQAPRRRRRRRNEANVAGGGDVRTLHRRLKRELQNLQGAPAAVVLGLPANSDLSLIEQAAERQRSRYQQLAANNALPSAVRGLARDIGELVERAYKMLVRGRSAKGRGTAASAFIEAPVTGGSISEEEQLLERGRAYIVRNAFAEADKVLSRARDLRLDHAGILANLGWARLNNPKIEKAERAEDARDLLLLAEQFDATDPDGQYYLARVMFDSGDAAGALKRAERALKARKDDPAIIALHRRIRAMVHQQP